MACTVGEFVISFFEKKWFPTVHAISKNVPPLKIWPEIDLWSGQPKSDIWQERRGKLARPTSPPEAAIFGSSKKVAGLIIFKDDIAATMCGSLKRQTPFFTIYFPGSGRWL
ncbi:MAG: hypothetical protein CMI56_00010 [Parcubacteria group bacterium]|nr:hypothetical protein [Parcubacteria group bacterium]